jgi:Tol biopolymer transport system component
MRRAGSRLGSAARLSLVLLVASFALAPLPAHAAFPGANGKIAFDSFQAPDQYKIYTVYPDGTGLQRLTSSIDSSVELWPAWSPDGSKIAFSIAASASAGSNRDIYVANADGTGITRLTTTTSVSEVEPAWSPDGTKIAFDRRTLAIAQIWVMNSDGTAQTPLTNGPDYGPVWSPTGGAIAFGSSRDDCTEEGCNKEVYTMNADGSSQTNITHSPADDLYPDWSPDGAKIAFSSNRDTAFGNVHDVWTMNPDGSGLSRLTDGQGDSEERPAWSPDGKQIAFVRLLRPGSSSYGAIYSMRSDGSGEQLVGDFNAFFVDWQPLPTASYAHPQSASQLNVSLVPAFRQCGTGGNPSDAAHSPPLATNSCNPPRPGSVLAAVGTASQSSAQMTVVAGDTDPTNGNQADLSLTANMTDIQATSGGDYNPNPSGADMTAVTRLRFTDKANGYGGLPATATEYDFKIPIDCSSTVDPSVGSTCTANMTANTLVPGLIQEQRQSIVQTFRVRVDDAGANGVRGDADDRIFATQGVFVP